VRIYVMPAGGGEPTVARFSSQPLRDGRPTGQWMHRIGSGRTGVDPLIRAEGPSKHADATAEDGRFLCEAEWGTDGYQTGRHEANTQIAVVRLDGGPPRTLNDMRLFYPGTNIPFDVSTKMPGGWSPSNNSSISAMKSLRCFEPQSARG